MREHILRGWKCFQLSAKEQKEIQQENKHVTAEEVSKLPTERIVKGILFGAFPPEHLYQSVGTRFGGCLSEYDESTEFTAYQDLLRNELEEEEIDLGSLTSAIWLARTEYHGAQVSEAELRLVRLAQAEYLKLKLEQSVGSKNLVEIDQLLYYAKNFNLDDSIIARAKAELSRLEQEAHQISEKSRPYHVEKYSMVIGELSERLYGKNINKLVEEATELSSRVLQDKLDDYQTAMKLKEQFDVLEKMPACGVKVKGLDEVVEGMKLIDTSTVKASLQELKTELKQKLRQIALLTTKNKQLERSYDEERDKWMQEKKDFESHNMLLLEEQKELKKKVDGFEDEKETVREETMEFAAQYLNEDFKKKTAAIMDDLKRDFALELESKLREKESSLNEKFAADHKVVADNIKRTQGELEEAKALIARQKATINELRAAEAKMKEKLSTYKAREKLGIR